MKRLAVKNDVTCMACFACVVACSEAFYKELNPDKSCIKVIKKNEEAIPVVCNQCGECAKVCEAGAITQNPKGVYLINKKLCTSCGKCKEVCPFDVIVKPTEAAVASKCTACGICVKACPADVLEIVEK